MYGFIYKIDNDYALKMGDALYFLEDNISDINSDVEIGNIKEKDLVEGYALRINTLTEKWYIIDTGHKKCKDIIASGNFQKGFAESLKKFIKIMK